MTATLVADLSCLLCARVAGQVVGTPHAVLRVTVIRPEHADRVLQRRCPDCGGALRAGEWEPAPRPIEPLTDDQIRPRRGRPPKPPALLRYSMHPCADCHIVQVRSDARRCRNCDFLRRAGNSLQVRIVAWLTVRGGSAHRLDLAEALGLPPDRLRRILSRMRARGCPISADRRTGRVRLEIGA